MNEKDVNFLSADFAGKGEVLSEITVLHVYRRDPLDDTSEFQLFGYYYHPNPAALEATEKELAVSNWRTVRVRYVRAGVGS